MSKGSTQALSGSFRLLHSSFSMNFFYKQCSTVNLVFKICFSLLQTQMYSHITFEDIVREADIKDIPALVAASEKNSIYEQLMLRFKLPLSASKWLYMRIKRNHNNLKEMLKSKALEIPV